MNKHEEKEREKWEAGVRHMVSRVYMMRRT